MATTPMISPDGTTGDIPTANVQQATQAGFKQAVAMTSPDGKLGYVPFDRAADARKAGFKTSITGNTSNIGTVDKPFSEDSGVPVNLVTGEGGMEAATHQSMQNVGNAAEQMQGVPGIENAVRGFLHPNFSTSSIAQDKAYADAKTSPVPSTAHPQNIPTNMRGMERTAEQIPGVAGAMMGATPESVAAFSDTAQEIGSSLRNAPSMIDRITGIQRAQNTASEARNDAIVANKLRYMQQEQGVSESNAAAQQKYGQKVQDITATNLQAQQDAIAANKSRYLQQEQETAAANSQNQQQAITANKTRYLQQEQDTAAANEAAQKAFQEKYQFPAGEKGEVAKINTTIGAKPKIGNSASDLADAGIDPGRGLRAEGFNAQQLDQMTPEQRGAAIVPKWNAAGKAVSLMVEGATDKGVTLDVGKSAMGVFNKIADPALQERAIQVFNDTARGMGIDDLRNATPTEARALRTALRSHSSFGPGGDLSSIKGIGTQLYRAVSGDLQDAVPGLQPIDQHYADLNEAVKANQVQMTRYGAGKPYSRLPQPPTPEQVSLAKYSPAQQQDVTLAKYSPATLKELPAPPTPEQSNLAKYTPPPEVPSLGRLRALMAAKAAPWLLGGTGAIYAGYRALKDLLSGP
jgi:hypothetical protein